MSTTELDCIDRVNLSAEELTAEVPVDEVALALDYLDALERRVREAKAKLRDAVKGWMLATGTKEFMVGETKWFIAAKKKEKCRDLKAAIEALYLATGGDFDAFVGVLSINAVKPGAAKKVLGSEFDRHFETTTEQDVSTHQPKRELQAVNTRFIDHE
jgi:hypothetical protein